MDFENFPFRELPFGELAVGELSVGEMSSGNSPSRKTPSGNVCWGTVQIRLPVTQATFKQYFTFLKKFLLKENEYIVKKSDGLNSYSFNVIYNFPK